MAVTLEVIAPPVVVGPPKITMLLMVIVPTVVGVQLKVSVLLMVVVLPEIVSDIYPMQQLQRVGG